MPVSLPPIPGLNTTAWLFIGAAFILGILLAWAVEMLVFRRLRARAQEQLESHVSDLTADLQTRDAEVSELRAKGKQDEAALADAQKAQVALAKERDQALAQVSSLKLALAAAQKEMGLQEATIKNQTLQMADYSLRLGDAFRELEAHKTKNLTLSSELARFTSDPTTSAALIDSLQHDNDELRQQIAGLSAEAHTREKDLAALQSQASEAAARQAEITRLETALADAQAEQARVAQEAAAALGQADALQTDLQARESEIAQQSAQLAELQTALVQAREQTAKVQEQAATSEQTVQALQAQQASQTSEIERMQAEAQAAAATQASLATQLQEREQNLGEVTQKFETLRAEYARTCEERSQLAMQVDQFKARAGAALKTVAAMPATPPVAAPPSVPAPARPAPPLGGDSEAPYLSACPQHLSDIKGIGSVFEGRLYAAGIGSYWQLANLDDEDLAKILGLADQQKERTDLASIRADAQRLADETHSKGRVWTAEPPDDLEPIEGIGFTYEKRLYDAGICTYEALANATVEQLDEICKANSLRKPDYASWIRQAQALAAQKGK